MNPPISLPPTIVASEVITLIPWLASRDDTSFYDARSAYVEQFWLATLGPSTTLFLRHCAGLLDGSDGTPVDLRETAVTLGIGHEGGSRSAMVKTVARACRFRAARPVGDTTLAVRVRLPQLSSRQVQRLPPPLRQRHEQYVASLTSGDSLHPILHAQARARRMALCLIECGDDMNETEVLLSRLTFHPAIAAEAVRWAWNQHHQLS